MTRDDQKRAVGEAAALLVAPGMTVGLGTGSTAAWFVAALAERGLDIACVATSRETEELGKRLGLRLIALDDAGQIDLTIDGADEIGPGLALIKGGGGALLREKLVWEASARCVAIADAGKRVAQLGHFPLPVEVTPFGQATTMKRVLATLDTFGITAQPRLRGGSSAFVTDNGNVIYDLPCGTITDPGALGRALKAITGVVEQGLFVGLASEALIADDAGARRLTP